MKIIAIIQARMASSRLPGKVLLDIGGQPMLKRVVERARRASTIDGFLVATTTGTSDDPLAAFCDQQGYACFRGSPFDVLDRYYQAARSLQADVIVRLTADCPLIDPEVIDQTVYAFLGIEREPVDQRDVPSSILSYPFDFAANRLPPPWKRTYPIGLDTEVCSFAALERAWKEANQPYQREHVMPYLYEEGRSVHYKTLPDRLDDPDSEGKFRVRVVDHDPDYGSLRWTVDTAEDLDLIRRIYAHFGNRDDFSWLDVLEWITKEPGLAQINAQVRHKSAYDVDGRAK